MKRKIIHDISASSLQVIINQLSAIVIFYLLSRYFTKNNFGDINWSLAVLMIIFPILGCGIDQLTVRKIAAGNEASSVVKIYLFHVLFTGLLFTTLLFSVKFFSGLFFPRLNVLMLLAIGQLFIFISIPFKQIANGKEQFRLLLLMSIGANIIKVFGLLLIAFWGKVSLLLFILLYIFSSAIELIVCLYLSKKLLNLQIGITVNFPKYKNLIKESLPQLGVIICNAGIARIDWILLGILSTSSVLAEYSFAYKAFELSTLPLLIVAPLLLPRITKWFHEPCQEDLEQKKVYLFLLARLEIMLASFGTLILNICWAPVIDGITDNKYGAVNHSTILILSCSVPFLYVNNILWSVNFAKGRMKSILNIFVATFAIVFIGNFLLIPFFRAEGAAVAYLAAIVIQTVYFAIRTQIDGIHKIIYYLSLCIGSALVSGLLAKFFTNELLLQLIIAGGIYVLLMAASRQIKMNDWFTVIKVARL